MARPNSRDPSNSLLHSRRSPWEVKVNDDSRILKVDSFTQEISSEKESNSARLRRRAFSGRDWCEAGDNVGSRDHASCDACSGAGEYCYLPVAAELSE